jgi:hypothetical protein
MTQIKESVKRVLSEPVYTALRDTRDSLFRIPGNIQASIHPWRRESIRKLRALKDTQTGKRCFIIGNGPSLKQTDLTKLKGEFTFGLNRIFLAFPQMGFETTYLVSVNNLMIEQSVDEMRLLKMPKFFTWRCRKWMPPSPELHYLYTTYTGERFAKDVTGRIWEGATVTNVALQVAFHMGFQQVILIGVDHNFVSQGQPNTTVVSSGDDPNHFSGAYFKEGFRWQLPDFENSERGYRLALKAYQEAGRSVLDATVGGKLTIFPKTDYESLF